jgi:hypothetical protein
MSSVWVSRPDPDLWLSTQVTVKGYLELEAAKNTAGIAKFIRNRFAERYITPLRNVRAGDDSGFLTMGVCCLLIEGLTAFREGWPSTRGRSEEAFRCFFGHEPQFAVFRGLEQGFWKGVRCGILHQGETSCGWRLNFTDGAKPLLEPIQKRVNCILFFNEMEHAVSGYCDELTKSPWDSGIWQNLRIKMEQTIKDCVA